MKFGDLLEFCMFYSRARKPSVDAPLHARQLRVNDMVFAKGRWQRIHEIVRDEIIVTVENEQVSLHALPSDFRYKVRTEVIVYFVTMVLTFIAAVASVAAVALSIWFYKHHSP